MLCLSNEAVFANLILALVLGPLVPSCFPLSFGPKVTSRQIASRLCSKSG